MTPSASDRSAIEALEYTLDVNDIALLPSSRAMVARDIVAKMRSIGWRGPDDPVTDEMVVAFDKVAWQTLPSSRHLHEAQFENRRTGIAAALKGKSP